jgi:hypothetical protein
LDRTAGQFSAQKLTRETRQKSSLFDHLVGEQLERVGYSEAEGCGGLEINDEFVFERELHWQIARICAS